MTSLCNLRFCRANLAARRLFAMLPALCLIAIMATSGSAQTALVLPVPYDDLARELPMREGFEQWLARPEPGHLLSGPHHGNGIAFGSHFAGQTLGVLTQRDGGRFDTLTDIVPSLPLTLARGPADRGLAVAHHRGFGSNAAFPLGPDGFAAISGRGEGSLAILFDADQTGVGFLAHSDYPDPLGSRPAARGAVDVIFLARDGQVLARLRTPLSQGVTALGYRTADALPAIAAMVILNTDPGGIAIDDIIFDAAPVTGKLRGDARLVLPASWQPGHGALLSNNAW